MAFVNTFAIIYQIPAILTKRNIKKVLRTRPDPATIKKNGICLLWFLEESLKVKNFCPK